MILLQGIKQFTKRGYYVIMKKEGRTPRYLLCLILSFFLIFMSGWVTFPRGHEVSSDRQGSTDVGNLRKINSDSNVNYYLVSDTPITNKSGHSIGKTDYKVYKITGLYKGNGYHYRLNNSNKYVDKRFIQNYYLFKYKNEAKSQGERLRLQDSKSKSVDRKNSILNLVVILLLVFIFLVPVLSNRSITRTSDSKKRH